jgi:hypothetical protein
MFWQITLWGDGTYFFTNAANDLAWHLTLLFNLQVVMALNMTAPQSGQLTCKEPGVIDNESNYLQSKNQTQNHFVGSRLSSETVTLEGRLRDTLTSPYSSFQDCQLLFTVAAVAQPVGTVYV